MTTILTMAAIAAVVGAVVGLVLSKVLPLPKAAGYAMIGLFAVGGGGVGYFLAMQDVIPKQEFDKARAAMDQLPDVQAIKQYYPNDYAELQRNLEVIKNERKGTTGVAQYVRAQANAVLLREARKGNDDNLVALMTLRRDKAVAIAEKSPAYCFEFVGGRRLSFDPDTIVGPEMVERERAITAEVLKQTATAPVLNAAGAVKDDEKIETRVELYYQVEVRDAVAAKARARFTPDEQKTIQMLASRSVSLQGDTAKQSLMCRYGIAQIDETLKLPKDKAAMVYRLNIRQGL
ncbi:MAG: hypothetical protein ACK4RV_00860 [Caulobacter sp.]